MDDLPRIRNGNYSQLMNSYARQSMPVGANQHKVNKAGLWCYRRPAKDAGTAFSLKDSLCRGSQEDVAVLGLKIAQEALEAGDNEYAKTVLEAVKDLHLVYERKYRAAAWDRKEGLLKRLAQW